jgi:hypothetical protein
MRRIILLVSMAVVMAALILTVAMPVLAAPPTFTASCVTPPTGVAIESSDPQQFNEVNAFYRNCKDSGGTATREVNPNPGAPTE